MSRERVSKPAEQPLPAAIDAEKAIIGAFFTDPAEVGSMCERRGFLWTHFHHPAHQTIFALLQSLWRQGAPCDFPTITQRLRDEGELDNVGGAFFVTELATMGLPASAAGHYAETIIEKHARREVIRAAEVAKGRAMDAGAATAEILAELRESVERVELSSAGGDLADFDSRGFSVIAPPPRPLAVFELSGKMVATAGNLMAIQAKAKNGKTAVLGAMMAAAMAADGDFLGFKSSNLEDLALLHFDTEQSPWDHHEGVLRALKRAGKTAEPDWLLSYCVTDYPLRTRRAIVRREMKRAMKVNGGILCVIIDGIGDLCGDPNDSEEANELVDDLHRLAIEFSTVIVCVLHENPGTEIGKTRGHLGSQLERKAETNLRLEKDSKGVTVLFCERGRHCHIPREWGPRFEWDDEKQMHVTTDAPFNAKADKAAKNGGQFAAKGDHAANLLAMLEKQTGHPMPELVARMGEEHGISKNPVYAAKKKLEAEGKAEMRNGKLFRI